MVVSGTMSSSSPATILMGVPIGASSSSLSSWFGGPLKGGGGGPGGEVRDKGPPPSPAPKGMLINRDSVVEVHGVMWRRGSGGPPRGDHTHSRTLEEWVGAELCFFNFGGMPRVGNNYVLHMLIRAEYIFISN